MQTLPSAAAQSSATSLQSNYVPRSPMKALVKEGNSVSVQMLPRPRVSDAHTVVVRVRVAGLCRTDLYAAQGKIKVCDPLVLGHEFSGVVEEIGCDVERVKPGDRVTVNPVLPCLNCAYCSRGEDSSCQCTTFLGVDRTGCFAEFIAVPDSAIYKLPEGISDLAAAYAEPIAAALAVLKANLNPDSKGLIYGKNRFSQLMEKILSVRDFKNIAIFDPSASKYDRVDEGAHDFVIETMISTEVIPELVRAVRPGGKIVLKSRQHEPVQLKITEILKKEPVFHVVNYGSFEEALDLLSTGQIAVDDLVDGVYKLEDYQRVMSVAQKQEALKPFFAPWED